jgi:MFS family permease
LRTAPSENFAGFINGASWGTQLSLLPLYAIHSGAEPGRALQLLTGMCVGSLACQPVVGRLIDRFSPSHVLIVCGAAQLAICAVLAQSIASDMAIWPLVFAWGAAVGGMYTAGLAGLGSKFAAGDLPAASTGFTMVWEVGALCGPAITGIAMQVWDPHGLAVVLAVLGGFLLLASLRTGPVLAGEPKPPSPT